MMQHEGEETVKYLQVLHPVPQRRAPVIRSSILAPPPRPDTVRGGVSRCAHGGLNSPFHTNSCRSTKTSYLGALQRPS